MGKKSKKDKSKKVAPILEDQYKSREERQHETLNVIFQLKQNDLTSKDPEIKELLVELNEYVQYGREKDFVIPFPRMNKNIIGKMRPHKNQECVVYLKHLE